MSTSRMKQGFSKSNNVKTRKNVVKTGSHSKSSKKQALNIGSDVKNKKRKKISMENRAYNPKRFRANSNSSAEGLMSIRCDTDTHVVNEEGVKEPLRTSAMINTSAVKTSEINTVVRPLSPRKINAAFLREVQKNKPDSFGRIVEIEERSEHGSPTRVKIKSPTKGSNNTYTASRDSTPGSSLSTYSNRCLFMDVVEEVDFLAADHTFYDSDAYQQIEKYFQAVKQQEVTLRKNSYGKKAINLFSQQGQQAVMRGKAEDYAAAAGLVVEGVEWEWLHEVGKLFARFLDKPQWTATSGLQSVDNLIAGTTHANTEMLLAENVIKKLLISKYPQGFTLRVKANLMKKKEDGQTTKEYLHMGTYLEYDIITPDFTLSKIFNLQTMNQPHYDYQRYVEAELKVHMDLHTDNEADFKLFEENDEGYESHCYKSKR